MRSQGIVASEVPGRSVPCMYLPTMLCSEPGTARDERSRDEGTRRRMWIADGVTRIDEKGDKKATRAQRAFYV